MNGTDVNDTFWIYKMAWKKEKIIGDCWNIEVPLNPDQISELSQLFSVQVKPKNPRNKKISNLKNCIIKRL